MSRRDFDVIVAGAGAAGLMCAIEPASAGGACCCSSTPTRSARRSCISGGGRCNFTNLRSRPEALPVGATRISASRRWRATRQHDFIALVERHGIAWHEKTLGQLFCDGSARQIVDMLLAECAGGRCRRCGWRTASPASRRPTASRSTPARATSTPARW